VALMKLEELANEGTQLATPPEIYFKLNQALNDEDCSFDEIGQIISMDPALTTELLKLVNSSYYTFKPPIETVNHALTIIGTKQLAELVLASSVIKMFSGIPENLVDMKSFWKHSIGCGLAARSLAELTGKFGNVESLFVAGLLHDIGRLILLLKVPNDFQTAIQKSQRTGNPLFVEEKKIWGFDHAELGGALIQNWKLPDRLVEVAKYHHQPELAKDFPIEVAITNLANSISYSLDLGSSGETNPTDTQTKAWEALGFSEDTVFPIVKEKVSVQFEETAKIFIDPVSN
jgi:HD-like signal output (HDOD) protein